MIRNIPSCKAELKKLQIKLILMFKLETKAMSVIYDTLDPFGETLEEYSKKNPSKLSIIKKCGQIW